MSHNNNHKKEFFFSSWAVDNRVTVYLLTFIIVILGILAYFAMPRESFPEIVQNKVYISTVYPGNSAEDVEKLITKKLEDKFKNVSGVEKVESNSFQDYCLIVVDFNEKEDLTEAKQKIKDKVDEAKGVQDWPNLDSGSKVEPSVFDLNISEEFPILNINIKGNYPKQTLKKFAEQIEDEMEDISEIKDAVILGVDDNEVEIALDLYKMNAAQVSFDNVIGAVKNENITISGGNLTTDGYRNNVRIKGQITSPNEIGDFMVKQGVRISDIGAVRFREKERTTYAREMGQDVVMVNLKKRAGSNMIDAIEQAKVKLKKAQETYIPKDVSITATSDQSIQVEHQVNELANHIIIGILLVMGVLSLSMGMKNSLFVGTAIPLSMLIAFAVLNAFGITLNTMVLFAMVMGLGMLVDDGIVVVDNVYANMEKGLPRREASKFGIGEIAFPVITSTLTTLAAFAPMLLWPGILGEFMKYFPITITVTLSASLFVALIINASMTGGSMTLKDVNLTTKTNKKLTILFTVIGSGGLLLGLITGTSAFFALATLSVLAVGGIWLYKNYYFDKIQHFQTTFFPNLELKYQDFLRKLLDGKPKKAFFYVVGLLFASFIIMGISFATKWTKVVFFPDVMPKQMYVYMDFPQGTDIGKTNQATKKVEKAILNTIAKYKDPDTRDNFLIESMITQLGKGAVNPQVDAGSQADTPHKSKVTLNFVEFNERRGIDTNDVLEEIRKAVPSVPGASITVEKQASGPPVGYPISIELQGNDYNQLIMESQRMISYINSKNIPGIEKLQTDVNKDSPEMIIDIDREVAGNMGVSTAFTGITLRRAMFGQDISTFKDVEDDYQIAVRLQDDQRRNQSALFNQPITFQNNKGQLLQIPISTFAKFKEEKTFSKIKRKNNIRTIMVYSNITQGANANEIVQKLQGDMKNYQLPDEVTYKFAGEQEEQGKNQSFLFLALFLALAMVTGIIVFQFNSMTKTVIIMMTILLSFSGVFLGLTLFKMDFVILMTMMGIISLAGVVVKNGIVLMDFFVLRLDEKIAEKGVETHDDLSVEEVKEVIIESGKARLRPVLLTATTAVLGLIPLAIGLNFDIWSFLTTLNPHLSLGGDNVAFWGPLAWTIIFGLTFATFLTLLIVPVMFYLVSKLKIKRRSRKLESLKLKEN